MPGVSSNREGNFLTNHVDRSIPRNSVALTRSIEIVVAGYVIGYVQSLSPSEGRGLWDCRELGNEDIVEIVPGGPKDLTISIERAMLYRSRMAQVFDDIYGESGHGNAKQGIRSLMDYNYPFDIVILLRRNTGEAGQDADLELDSAVSIKQTEQDQVSKKSIIILDHFHECWWQDMKYGAKVGDEFQMIESGTCKYTWRTGDVVYTPTKGYKGSTREAGGVAASNLGL